MTIRIYSPGPTVAASGPQDEFRSMAQKDIKRVVLAYSGGLDTSIILKWLQTTYNCEVVTFTADLGQGEELEPARKKAELLGIKPEHIFIEDLREEFVRDYVFPMFRANAQYEGLYLLGTSIARPLIAKKQIEIARRVGADAVSHGATGKGNDQVRFELGYYALEPEIKVIAPWREWDMKSREQLIAFAEEHQIPIAKDKRGDAPFSVDANLLHSSSEGKVLEDPWVEPPEYVHMRTISPEDAPDVVTEIVIDFEKGDPVAVDDDGAVDDLIAKESYKRFYMHRTSHWLGMDVHDVGSDFVGGVARPFVPGVVLTIEPGIYVSPDDVEAPAEFRGIGIRIEDDVLVTANGHEVLSAAAPKTVDDIERACRT